MCIVLQLHVDSVAQLLVKVGQRQPIVACLTPMCFNLVQVILYCKSSSCLGEGVNPPGAAFLFQPCACKQFGAV